MKALIIEDEVLASKHLIQVLGLIDEIIVLDSLESISDTIAWFGKNTQPDIVFMDIHLADGLAFEIFRHINISCPIIFTTAYDEYALRAFKVNSIDYLLKPVEVSDVRNALRKLKDFSVPGDLKEMFSNLVNSYTSKYRSSFLVPVKGDKLIPVQTCDIACFYIDAGIVKALLSDGKPCKFDHTLDELEQLLDPLQFFRANRQFIISRTAIKDVDLWYNGRLSINLKINTPGKIIISKVRSAVFKRWSGA
jgi:DNA-binding LytR/AlgR family response regulator